MNINQALLKAIEDDRIDTNHFKTYRIAKFLSKNVGGLFYGGIDKDICYVDGVAIMQFEKDE